MGYRVITAPVLLVLACGHADGCSEELSVRLDPQSGRPLEGGVFLARTQRWFADLGDEEDLRTLPRVYCPEHATEGGFRRGVLGMWDGE